MRADTCHMPRNDSSCHRTHIILTLGRMYNVILVIEIPLLAFRSCTIKIKKDADHTDEGGDAKDHCDNDRKFYFLL